MHFVSLRENPQPLAAHRVEIRAHEEMQIVLRVREHPAIAAADRAGTNHCDFSERRPIHRLDSIPQSAIRNPQCKSGPAGIRTRNQGIMSPLL